MDGAIASLRPGLLQILSALSLSATPATVDILLGYLSLLQRWNSTYNLTSVREPRQMLTQHLADCLAIFEPLRRTLGDRDARILDVGSGGGLPGAVLAAVESRYHVTCVDTVGKKAAFIQQVAAELGLPNLQAVHGRVELMSAAPFDVVASRAFASLLDFTIATRRHLAPGGVWMAMKGKRPSDEMSALPPQTEVFHVEQITVPGLEAERCLVWMRPLPFES